MADLELVIEQHELGWADILPPPIGGQRGPAVRRPVCIQCYAHGLLGELYGWRDYSRHLAKMIEEARA